MWFVISGIESMIRRILIDGTSFHTPGIGGDRMA